MNVHEKDTFNSVFLFQKQCCSEAWTSHSTYPIMSVDTELPNVVFIKGLEHGVTYVVRTVLINEDFNSYEGNDIPATNFTSLCISM